MKEQQMSDATTTPGNDGNNGGGTSTTDEGFKPITSQEDLNRVITERVNRERAKFADYKDVKAKAARLDEIEAANQTEAEKFSARIAALEAENQRIQSEALRSRIQAKFKIADEDAELFLTGTDEESLTRQAQRLADREADRSKRGPHVPGEGTTPPPPGIDRKRQFLSDLTGRDN
jgi:hypothetical protein